MKFSLYTFFVLILVVVGSCGRNEPSQKQPAAEHSAIKFIDKDINYIVTISKQKGEFFTEDDCRCEYGVMKLTEEGKSKYLSFNYCDSIYSDGKYLLLSTEFKNNVLRIFGKCDTCSQTDTIDITQIQSDPLQIKVHRSNTDIGTSGFFYVPQPDSARYEHYKVNCDENQG